MTGCLRLRAVSIYRMRYRTERSHCLHTYNVHFYTTCQRRTPKSQFMLENVVYRVEKRSQLQSGTLDPRQQTLSLLTSYIEVQSV
jgi:hypothetical protein